MITVCWAAKGGSGTTVVVASMALAARRPTLVVDLDGDLPAVLGVPESDRAGLFDWLRSTADAARLAELTVNIADGVTLLPRGRPGTTSTERWSVAVDWLRAQTGDVLVDAGTTVTPCPVLVHAADHALLVSRPCYLAMRAARRLEQQPTGVIVIEEPGRQLSVDDVIATVGAPLAASVMLDPKIARAADAGLLVASLPSGFRRSLQHAA
jgi:hypothetical protein